MRYITTIQKWYGLHKTAERQLSSISAGVSKEAILEIVNVVWDMRSECPDDDNEARFYVLTTTEGT